MNISGSRQLDETTVSAAFGVSGTETEDTTNSLLGDFMVTVNFGDILGVADWSDWPLNVLKMKCVIKLICF